VTFLRALMLLALIVWIGGIIFFAFVMAPTLFIILPNAQLAGNVVSPALTRLHWMGLVSGVVFLLSSIGYNWRKYLQPRLLSLSHVLVVLMLLLTAISQFAVTRRMRELRAERSDTPAAVAEFERLHEWSTRIEGGVLVLGLIVVILTARENSR
jgi:uncharacterized membrane protein